MKSLYTLLAGPAAFFAPFLIAAQTADTFHLTACARYWANQRLIPNVQMTVGVGPLDNPAYASTGTLSTDSTCSAITVTLDSAAPQTGYWLTGEKTGPANDSRNGLSVGDLICIHKHLLGLEPLPPILWFAADANSSRSITQFDVVEFSRLLLGVYDQLPNAPGWRILHPDCMFPGPSIPFPFNPCPVFSMDPLANFENQPAVLTGIKAGEVTGDYAFDGNYQPDHSLAPHTFRIPDRVLKAGETVDVPLDMNLSLPAGGVQFALHYDTSILQLQDILYNGTFPEQWAVFTGAGLVKHASTGLANDFSIPLASVRFLSLSDGKLSEALSLDSMALPPRYYTDCIQAGRLRLEFDALTSQDDLSAAIRFRPPFPNPFYEKTTLVLTLERPETVLLEVYDLSGRLTFSQRFDLPAGGHSTDIPPAAVPAGGMGVYRLVVGANVYTGKLIRL